MRLPYLLYSLLLQPIAAVEWAQQPAPYQRPEGSDLIDDNYFVRLKPGYTFDQHWTKIGMNLSQTDPDFVDLSNMNGYAAKIDNSTLHDVIRHDPGVANVEHDHWVQANFDTDHGFTKGSVKQRGKRWIKEVMQNLNWPAYMITSRTKQSNIQGGKYRYNVDTVGSPGKGVDIYILDSGIHISHQAFEGRASHFNGASQTPYCPRGDKTMDDNIRGHGTKVASLAMGAEFSVSQANAINVKIWCGKDDNESAPASLLAKAISDVTNAHRQKQQIRPKGWAGSIINMSLQSAQSGLIEEAIETADSAGITVVVSANNADNPSSSNTFPCAWPWTVCVGSIDRNYKFSAFGNYGKRLAVLAPGELVPVAVNYNDDGSTSGSGTSLATPVVSSVLSHFIGYETIIFKTATAKQRMKDNLLTNVASNVPPQTINAVINTGINYWNKRGPYIGSDGGELKVRSAEPGAPIVGRAPALAGRNVQLAPRDSNSSNDSASTTITTSYTYSFTSETESATYEGVLPTMGLNGTNATSTAPTSSPPSTSPPTSSSTASSTSSSSSTTSSSSSSSSTPTPSNAIIATYDAMCDDSSDCAGTYEVYGFTPGSTPPQPCTTKDKSIWNTNVANTHPDGTPADSTVNLGPFTVGSATNCYYKQDNFKQTPGTLTCDGNVNVNCQGIDVGNDCNGYPNSYWDLGTCTW
ncbi:subtilisin-like protein [Viridothelium virens]|uniref:Subtilisin-like protein n=1 Tax=Viridothelium virens TaxID=1048519 RepID=A0A6A6H0S8_VIRVR|nr:subtilisin-like protein [Viridothelium virens]